jgi:hypothetical protein
MNDLDHIPDDTLNEAAVIALAQLRREKHDPDWLPTLHWHREFETRILDIVRAAGYSRAPRY